MYYLLKSIQNCLNILYVHNRIKTANSLKEFCSNLVKLRLYNMTIVSNYCMQYDYTIFKISINIRLQWTKL